jgi:arylformamidase
MTEWIDVSMPLKNGMVRWPDNPPVSVRRVLDMSRGDICNVSELSMGSHTGTHVDAPVHFVSQGKGIDEISLDATIGPARIIEISDKERITRDELVDYEIRKGERVLFKTTNSSVAKSDKFVEDFVYITRQAAAHLASLRVLTVGVDYLSVGGFKADAVETHRALLEAGVCIIEGLDLSKVGAGIYELVCLPIKIVQGDGAPARAVLRKISKLEQDSTEAQTKSTI